MCSRDIGRRLLNPEAECESIMILIQFYTIYNFIDNHLN